jgi:hypothetical protein
MGAGFMQAAYQKRYLPKLARFSGGVLLALAAAASYLRSARNDLQSALNGPGDIPPGREQRAAASDAGEKVAVIKYAK